jgi:hypothetical protein
MPPKLTKSLNLTGLGGPFGVKIVRISTAARKLRKIFVGFSGRSAQNDKISEKRKKSALERTKGN